VVNGVSHLYGVFKAFVVSQSVDVDLCCVHVDDRAYRVKCSRRSHGRDHIVTASYDESSIVEFK
jgi:hypothetical protein